MSNKTRAYTPIKLNNGTEIRINTFLSISDYFSLKELSEIPKGMKDLEGRLIEMFIFPDDREKIGLPLSNELLSHIAHELYINEFINEKSSDLEGVFNLLMENKLLEESMKNLFSDITLPTLVQPSPIKLNLDKINSIGSSIQKAAASMAAITQSISGIAEKLGEQLRSLTKDFSQYFDELEIDNANNNFAKFYLYDEGFKYVNILVDDSFFFYIKDSYESIFDFVDSIPSERDKKKKYLEKVFLEYWIYCIEEKPELLTISSQNLNNPTINAFLKELKTTMGNANYIAGIILLHIYLEKIIQDKLSEFEHEDFKKIIKRKLPKKLENASDTTKFRYILRKEVYEKLTNIQEKSLDAFDKYAPLYFFTRALYLYDGSIEFQRRNNLIHFNGDAKYETLDLMQMMKLFQLLKIVLENKEVPGLLDEWTKAANQKKQPLDII